MEKIRQWARTYGDSTRQLSVRAKSTKDNPGTSPISAYGRRKLPNNPASLEDLTESLEEESVTADVNEENVEGEESIALVANKDDVILVAKFKEISESFILAKLAQNLKRTSSKVKTHLYASDPEYCLIRVHRSGRETSCDWNRLGSAVYRQRFSYLFKPRALRRMSRGYKGG